MPVSLVLLSPSNIGQVQPGIEPHRDTKCLGIHGLDTSDPASDFLASIWDSELPKMVAKEITRQTTIDGPSR